MSWLYALVGAASLGLFIYLLASLLNAEEF